MVTVRILLHDGPCPGAIRAPSTTFPPWAPHANHLLLLLLRVKRSETERIWLSNFEREKLKIFGIWGNLSQKFTGSCHGKCCSVGWRRFQGSSTWKEGVGPFPSDHSLLMSVCTNVSQFSQGIFFFRVGLFSGFQLYRDICIKFLFSCLSLFTPLTCFGMTL